METALQVIDLLSGLLALVASGITLYFLIKKFVEAWKQLDSDAKWKKIMAAADKAMVEAEATGKVGAEKKEIVIEAVKAGVKELGIDADEFIDQLADYIDQAISFANSIAKKE